MSKFLSFLCIIAGLFHLLSCTEENAGFGSDLVNDVSVQLEAWDTLSLKMSTVKYDTVITSGSSRMLVGNLQRVEGQRPGTLDAKGVFQLSASISKLNSLLQFSSIGEKRFFQYDSASFKMTFDGYSLGKEEGTATYKLFQLKETLEYPKDKFALYNLTGIAEAKEGNFYDQDMLLGEQTVTLEEGETDSIEFKLSDVFVKGVFDHIANRTEGNGLSQDSLRNFLKGFVIASEQTDDFVAGFTFGSIRMKINFHDTLELSPEARMLEINYNVVNNNALIKDLSFNQYDTDFTEDPMFERAVGEDTSKPIEVSTNETNQVGYLWTEVGMGVRVEIPSLYDFYDQFENIIPGRSTLTLRAAFLEGVDPFRNMNSLLLFKVNEDNEIIKSYGPTGGLVLDREFGKNTYYKVDVSDFIAEQLLDRRSNGNALLMTLNRTTDTPSGLESLVIGASNSKELKSNININLIKRKDE